MKGTTGDDRYELGQTAQHEGAQAIREAEAHEQVGGEDEPYRVVEQVDEHRLPLGVEVTTSRAR